MELWRGRFKMTLFWTLCIFHWELADSGKTATKVGLAGIATVAGGSSGGYTGQDSGVSSLGLEYVNGSSTFVNDLQRLKYELFGRRQYDRTMRPVIDPTTITPVFLDFTMRQVLDLDEKNQVLKTYVWMRTFWFDEFLTWNKSEYGGQTKLWVPASNVWRPDIIVYEDTGNKDYNPRLPYATITHEGRVSVAEPTAFETSCSIDIAFFPFDYQSCSLTFTSWTFPSDQLDVISRKTGKELMQGVEAYFMKSGEWQISTVTVTKASENFGSIALEGDVKPANLGDEFPDTSHIKRMRIEETKTVKEVAPDRLTDVHWADIKYTFLLRRNSSLYMQSMLFPAILLTTVALLGFYLPPDSGERIGLQITILLTFMVFLLTVGEMFPASTGPFLGVYYVLCMALLGVNLFMTVLVLHLHYMPSAAVMGPNRDGVVTSKPVPKWIRLLLYIAKFRIRKHDEGRCSPTSQIVRSIMKTGHLSARSQSHERVTGEEKKVSKEWQEDSHGHNGRERSEKQNGKRTKIVITERTSMPPRFQKKKKVSPSTSVNGDDASGHVTEDNKSEAGSADTAIYGNADNESNTNGQVLEGKDDMSGCSTTASGDSFANWSSKSSGSGHPPSDIYEGCPEGQRKVFQQILGNLNTITSYLKSQNTHLLENDVSEEVENEWKAMARTIDKLCMKFYMALLIISHASILGAALVDSHRNGASE